MYEKHDGSFFSIKHDGPIEVLKGHKTSVTNETSICQNLLAAEIYCVSHIDKACIVLDRQKQTKEMVGGVLLES